jgi:hypothetical protein
MTVTTEIHTIGFIQLEENLMFKTIRNALAALSIGLLSSFAFAHNHGEGKMGGDIAGKHEQCKTKGCCKSQSMLATADGGVIILCGKSLMKYDKNLKLVKEVEVECSACCKKDSTSAGSDGQCERHPKKEMGKTEAVDKKAPAPAAQQTTPAAPANSTTPAAPAKK